MNGTNKSPPQIYRDRRGEIWITAEGLRRYFLISVPEGKKYFYNYRYFGGDSNEKSYYTANNRPL